MGTLLGWLRFRSARRLEKRVPPRSAQSKYILLGGIVAMAALGSLTLLVLDPIALLTRTVTTSVVPGRLPRRRPERAGMTWGPTVGLVVWVEDHFRGSVLPTIQPRFDQAIALFLVLLTVVLLNLLADRFWCRYLCPLGALLGLVARSRWCAPSWARLRRLRRLRHAPAGVGAIEAGRRARRRLARSADAAPPASSAPSARCAWTASSPAPGTRRMSLGTRSSPGRGRATTPGAASS